MRILTLISLLLLATSALAQPDEEGAFVSLAPRLEAVAPLDIGQLDRGWEAQPGAVATLEAPFYLGTIGVGARVGWLTARADSLPDVRTVFFFTAWRAETPPLWQRLRLGLGGRIGLDQMTFEEGFAQGHQVTEQEVLALLDAHALVDLGGGWSISGRVAYGRLFLAPRTRSVWAGVGLARSFRTPSWLRRVLR